MTEIKVVLFDRKCCTVSLPSWYVIVTCATLQAIVLHTIMTTNTSVTCELSLWLKAANLHLTVFVMLEYHHQRCLSEQSST